MLQANRRTLISWLALLAALILMGIAITLSAQYVSAGTDDFVEYWAAGRLNISGGNPYGAEDLWPLQQAAGRRAAETLMMWNPPYTLALVMPFGRLPYPLSRLLWLTLSLILILLSAQWSWTLLGGPRRATWVALLLALTFFPSLVALRTGQISPILLFGVVGFLYFNHRGKYGLAGVFVALLAVKPHVLYLVGVALLVWSLRRREWRMLGGAALTLAIAAGVAISANPLVFQQYLQANMDSSPLVWMTPTAGSLMRFWFGSQHRWLQFVFVLPGLVWLAIYGYRHRESWVWAREMPVVLLMSAVTAPFGWSFDLVVVVPVVLVVARMLMARPPTRRAAVICASYLAMNVVAWTLSGRVELWQVWLAPATSLWYLLSLWWLGHGTQTPQHTPL